MSSLYALCAAEELALARQARQTQQAAREILESQPRAQRILRCEAGSRPEIERLREAADACDAAGEGMIQVRRLLREVDQHHWRLAMSAAYSLRREARRFTSQRVDREDLVQHGYIGLLEAARRFDPSRELRFCTYARWWIRALMERSLENSGRLVRLPSSAAQDLRRLAAARRARQTRGEPIDLAAIAQEAGITEARACFLLQRGSGISLEETSEDGSTVQERLVAELPAGDCEAQLIQRQELANLDAAVGRALDERERMILTRHYGLDGEKSSTLTEIGGVLGLSRERVRQLEGLSLQHLRFIL